MEGMIRWFSRNHVAANFLMLTILLAGGFTWIQLRKEIFPEIAIDAIAISVLYPNATPDEVQEGVCIPIEEAIADIEGIKKISSTSAESNGAVTVEVETGYDVREVMSDLKTRVDAIDNFAENAEKPILEEIVISSQVLSIAISSNTDESTLRKLGEEVREGLLDQEVIKKVSQPSLLGKIKGDPKITKVSLTAVRPYEISIEVSEQRLRQYGMTMAEVAEKVRVSSADLPGGSIKTQAGEIVLRAQGKKREVAEFEQIPMLSLADGTEVILANIATIRDGFEDIETETSFNGKKAVLVNVFRTGNQDTLTIAKAAKDYIKQKQYELPDEVSLEVWRDDSMMLVGRLDLLRRNGTTGLILVFIVLALFLRPSLAFLVALGIPVSFAGAIWLMPMLGVSVNMISLFAFIVVLGIVVDDAIVVGENVYSRIRKGEHPREAAWKGTHEVGVVVTFGILTTVAAFTPMLGLSGVSGKIWPNIPLVVIPTLLFSLVQSKLVLPAHLALLKPTNPDEKKNRFLRLQQVIANSLEIFIQNVYQPFLRRVLQARYIVLSVFLFLLLTVFGIVKGKWMKFEFFPEVEADLINAKLEMPRGVSFEQTREVIALVEEKALGLGEIYQNSKGESVMRNVLASAGTQPLATGFNASGVPTGNHLGEVTIELAPAASRKIEAKQLVQEWREAVGLIPGVVSLTFATQSAGGGNALDLTLTGNEAESLQAAGSYVVRRLSEIDGAVDAYSSDRKGKQELRIKALTPAARARGLTLQGVATQVRQAFYGEEAQRLLRGKEELKVMVRYPEKERRSLENFEQMKLVTPDGSRVPLSQMVLFEEGYGPDVIKRINRKRAVEIKCDVDKKKITGKELVETLDREVMQSKEFRQLFPSVNYTFEGEQKDRQDSIKEIFIGFVFALIAMYVLMAIPLKSYSQPLIILSVIPFGIVGAVTGHLLLGYNLSMMSVVGIVALAGVVVNDSLVLVDHVNRHRDLAVKEAVSLAGARRFRAILLTSLTTFVGLMPMLLEKDFQAKFLIPMAISLGFGILFATMITLILVPSIYVILDDLKKIPRVIKWLLPKGRSTFEL